MVDLEIPLLLSGNEMKNLGAKINLKNDRAEIFGKIVLTTLLPLSFTDFCMYASVFLLPLSWGS